jgi:Signal transduction histidine kinase regulating C4-dicarboxylate transport system
VFAPHCKLCSFTIIPLPIQPSCQKEISITSYTNEKENIIINIQNNGQSIPSEIAENIFTPFFTTKENGSGIGLSISKQIMLKHGGSLTLSSNKDGNVCFSLEIN